MSQQQPSSHRIASTGPDTTTSPKKENPVFPIGRAGNTNQQHLLPSSGGSNEAAVGAASSSSHVHTAVSRGVLGISADNMVVGGLILGNVVSVVGIIALNKTIYNMGFQMPTLLMSFHFLCTWFFVVCAKKTGWFEEKRIPTKHYVTLGFIQMCSVAFVNLSLLTNSVGMYQLLKFINILVMCVFEYLMRGKVYSCLVYVSLVCLVCGISLATVQDVSMTVQGLIYGMLGALATAVYQVLNKKVQTENDVQPLALLQFEQPFSALFSFLFSFWSDDWMALLGMVRSSGGGGGVGGAPSQRLSSAPHFVGFDATLITLLLMSGVFAFGVNVTVYAIIGKTSPITFGVTGHVKTLGVLFYGFFVLKEEASWVQLIGFVLATAAMIAYSHLPK